MRALLPAFVLALALAFALAPASAQEHGHANENGASMVLFDGPTDGRAVVGAYTHFGFALLDKDAKPVPHQNAEFNVLQDGEVVFSTTDTHEYDGLFSLDLRFTRTGPYEVIAQSGEMELGTFRGEVVEPVNETEATIALTATPRGPASRIVDFEISILDPAGAIIPHTDAIVELRATGDDSLFGRLRLHIHDEPIRFSQALGPDTEYVAQVVGYKAFATGRSSDVRAIVAQFPVSVGPVGDVVPPAPELAPPAVLEQVGATASADGITLRAMYDPSNQVSVLQLARIAAIVVDDANHTAKQHVDFAMTLAGPRGTVFETASSHEYDGMFEFLFRPDVPGSYEGTIEATYDATELVVPIRLLVVPPTIPLLGGTGPITLGVEGVDDVVAGVEQNLTFSAMGPDGPAKHSEVDVTISHEDEPPLYQFKLHTHESGLTNAVVLFPHEGDWKIRIDGLPTIPEPAVYAPALVEFAVAPAVPVSEVSAATGDGAQNAVPNAWLFVTLAAGAIALLMRRRP